MSDFPAAHSMDTTWFAIDADGYVGIFDSGEDGAVPEDLPPSNSGFIECQGHLLELLAADNGRLIDRAAIDVDFIWQIIEEHHQKTPQHLQPDFICGLFLIVSAPDVISELQREAEIVIELYRDDDRIILHSSKCRLPWLKAAMASGKVLAGSSYFNLEDNLHLLGWYCYNYGGARQVHPYDRARSPKKPIRWQDLPPEIRVRLRSINLNDVRFADCDAIQPIEHLPCLSWSSEVWVDNDGKVHEWDEGFPDYSVPYRERFPDREQF